MIKNSSVLVCFLLIAAMCLVWVPESTVRADRDWQGLDTHMVDEYMAEQMRAHRLPGAALAIVRGGEVVYARGYGQAGADRALTENTPMYIGSVSKSFTALAVMQLVEQGQVDLDAPVQRYVPWFTLAAGEQVDRMTVRHLLNQTSGLAHASLPLDHLPEQATLRQAVEALATAKLVSEPGAEYLYCNHNYTLLGMLVEEVSGKSFAGYVQEHIFDPLGMDRSFTARSEAVNAGLAEGYNHLLGFPVIRRQPQPQWDLPAGYLISSAVDMGRYLAFQLGAQTVELPLVSADSLAVMHTPPEGIETRYAMGWYWTERNGVPTLEHNGDVETFHSTVVLMPDQDTAFVLLFNLNGLVQVAAAYEGISSGLAALLDDQTPQAGVPLWLVYMLLVILLIFDLGRKVVALVRIDSWLHRLERSGRTKAIVGIVADIVLALLLAVGLPLLIVRQAGVTALRLTAGFYHTDLAVYLVLTALLSLAVGIRRAILLRQNPISVQP